MSLPERVEVLAIGDEILDGRVVDTNSVRLAQRLAEVGLRIQQRTAITDDLAIIVREAGKVAERGTQLCIVSGGLGPTSDDLTAAAFAEVCGVELVRDAMDGVRASLGGIEHCEVQAERRVSRGGAVVRTPDGDVDARIETKLVRAREVVEAALGNASS